MEDIAIVGWMEGNAGQVHSWIGSIGYRVAFFVHPWDEPPHVDFAAARAGRTTRLFDSPTETSFKGTELLSAHDWPALIKKRGVAKAAVILDDKAERLDNIARAESGSITLINSIHPTALIMPDAILGKNILLHARAFIGYRAELCDGVIVNTGAQIEHHNVIREGATIDTGVLLNGNVTVERRAHIHSGVIAIPRITIGEDAIVGAGSVLIADVPPRSLVVGNPGHVVKTW